MDATRQRRNVRRMVEEVLGCKWTLRVLGGIRRGIARPGALEREITGISTKVLNERLRKLVRFGVIERRAYPEVPPRVEYRLTPMGRKFARVLDAVEALEAEIDGIGDGAGADRG
jgi:DNA-binding HxlR family transcriptional regulator